MLKAQFFCSMTEVHLCSKLISDFVTKTVFHLDISKVNKTVLESVCELNQADSCASSLNISNIQNTEKVAECFELSGLSANEYRKSLDGFITLHENLFALGEYKSDSEKLKWGIKSNELYFKRLEEKIKLERNPVNKKSLEKALDISRRNIDEYTDFISNSDPNEQLKIPESLKELSNDTLQLGHICKLKAIETVLKFFNKNSPPLHKHKEKSSDKSIRSIAKSHGSIQGEVLELEQLILISNDINLKPCVISFGTYLEFKEKIISSLEKGMPVFICYLSGEYIEPEYNVDIPINTRNALEHAGIITDYNPANDEFKVLTKSNNINTSIFFNGYNLYLSNSALADVRKQESYLKRDITIKEQKIDISDEEVNKFYKYDVSQEKNKHEIKTITPKNRGFRGVVVAFEEAKEK